MKLAQYTLKVIPFLELHSDLYEKIIHFLEFFVPFVSHFRKLVFEEQLQSFQDPQS